MPTTIDRLLEFCQMLAALCRQNFSHYRAWYDSADILTQYAVLVVTGMGLFLLTAIFVLSRITK